MTFLLDTNVLSEAMKERPNSGVLAWLSQVNEDEIFVSVVTITELCYGVERLASGKRRDLLDGWLRRDLISRFKGRVLPVDLHSADACGGLIARSESMGRPIEARDLSLPQLRKFMDSLSSRGTRRISSPRLKQLSALGPRPLI
jgi:toxin FitB